MEETKVYIIMLGDKLKLYSSMENLLHGYISECKNYYKDYAREVRGAMSELSRNVYNMTEEVRTELMNYIQEKPYKPVFTLDDLEKLDTSFKFSVAIVE